ncbi:hypothetical protein NDU88_001599 [Pleurodeles waltl]|uniref:Transposase n=1 Tax=Pleurodeles waltl TaxID=8319 RepID=A0AAV7RDB2_PLEWA|nr:hypothetical protein NDU88_001599 [Pleurodeles waltl]
MANWAALDETNMQLGSRQRLDYVYQQKALESHSALLPTRHTKVHAILGLDTPYRENKCQAGNPNQQKTWRSFKYLSKGEMCNILLGQCLFSLMEPHMNVLRRSLSTEDSWWLALPSVRLPS